MSTNTVIRFLALSSLTLLSIVQAHAQITFGPSQNEEASRGEIRELNWMNHNFLDKQRRLADSEIRKAAGRQLHKDRGDLRALQKAIDSGAFKEADKQTLQALGVALGDVFANAHPKLNWRVYEDKLGASHAVCLEDSEECLFPMTMISRRIEGGVTPDVNRIFNTNLEAIKSHMPYVPYSRDYSEELKKIKEKQTSEK